MFKVKDKVAELPGLWNNEYQTIYIGELTDEQIQEFREDGYIVEEMD